VEPAGAAVADSPLGPALRDICVALGDEIAAAEADPTRAFDVTDGHCFSSRQGEHLYGFRADVPLPLPPETPVRLRLPEGQEVAGVLVAVHDFEVIVELREPAGDAIDRARVFSEPWFILAALRARLAAALEGEAADPGTPLALLGLAPADSGEDPGAADLVCTAAARLERPRLVPNAGQAEAIARCAGSRLHFVWGPPGTGKTSNLAQVVHALVGRGERVLVLAHANAAVDVAMLRVAELLEGRDELAEGKVLRLGHPQLPEITARPEILPEQLLARTLGKALGRRRALEAQRGELTRRLRGARRDEERERLADELEATRAGLGGIRETLRQAQEALVRTARVLGATLSRLVIDDVVWSWPADSVVVDETSMAAFPFVMAAALRAPRRLLLFGDFRQLPPIARAGTPPAREWLARDAFEVSGVRERIDRAEGDPRVSLLDTQYRMAAPIAAVVSDFAYEGRLRSADSVRAADVLAERDPWPGAAVVLVDTSALAGVCVRETRGAGWSRANPIHALLAIDLARQAGREDGATVAVVTPYRVQARILAAGVAAATVHRFQGSERDVVLLDLVDGPPQAGASHLTGREPQTALRLLNVAISRARGKLLVLADVPFVQKRHPPWSAARRLVERLAAHGRVARPDVAWLREQPGRGDIAWFDGWPDAIERLARDLERVRGAAWLDLPDGVLRAVLPAVRALARRGARAVVYAGAEGARAPDPAAPASMASMGVETRTRPQPAGAFALLDGQVAWVGGREPVARAGSRELAAALARALTGET
jgi:hypothetical protein